MSLWGSNDASSNSVIYTGALVNKTPNTANRDAMYGNTTSGAFTTGQTVGVFGVAADEVAASDGAIAHTGWVVRRTGTGGRAGRIQTEVLVAGGISSDGDTTVIPNYLIKINTRPANASANATSNQTAVFTVAAVSKPVGATLTYLWEANTGSGFANAGVGTTGNTTASLTVNANTATNGAQYRVIISATGANTVTSNAAVITVTT